jgi:hypothetical protein
MKWSWVVFGAVVLAAPARADEFPKEGVVRGELGAKLDAYFSRLPPFGYAGGLVVTKGNEIVLAKGYGLADRQAKRPVTAQSVFCLGSITKQFTGAAILKLEMQGKLGTSDLLSKFVGSVPPDKEGITLHHLLTHTAGLPSDLGPSDYEAVSRDEIVKRALATKLLTPPGRRYRYSNVGYSLLGAVVEIVSGQPYEAFLREHLFLPAGMPNTGYRLPKWDAESLAQGYQGDERWGTVVERLPADGPHWNLRANGGVHSTLTDMLRWHRALEGEKVLSAAAKEKLFAPHTPEGDGDESHYGYGWAIFKTRRGTKLVAHNGGNGILSADCRRYVDDGVFVFVTSTSSEWQIDPVSRAVDRLVFGGDCPTPPAAVALDAEKVKALVGTYRLPSGTTLTVTAANGRLKVVGDGAEALTLLLGGGRGDAPRQRAAIERTREMVEARAKGDFGPLHRAFGGRMPVERIRQIEEGQRRELVERLGAFRGYDVLGAVPREDVLDVYVRQRFERGDAYLRCAWDGEQLAGIRGLRALPATQTFVATSPTEFAAFRLEPPLDLRLTVRTAADGSVTDLTVRAGGDEIRAVPVRP